jgi:hypothetical protein
VKLLGKEYEMKKKEGKSADENQRLR